MKTESSSASKTELPSRFRQFAQQYPAVMRAYEALGAAAQAAGPLDKDPRTRQARHRHRRPKRRRHPQPYSSRVGGWCHAGGNPSRRAARHDDSRLSGYDGRDDVGGRCPRCRVGIWNLKFWAIDQPAPHSRTLQPATQRRTIALRPTVKRSLEPGLRPWAFHAKSK